MADSILNSGAPQRDCDYFLELLDVIYIEERNFAAEERAFFEEHARCCSSCRVLADALDEAESPPPVHIDSVRKAADTYFEEKAKNRRKRLYPLVAAAAAVFILGVSAVFFTQSAQPTPGLLEIQISQGALLVDGESTQFGARLDWRPGSRLVAKEQTLLSENDELSIQLEPDTAIALSLHKEQKTRLRLIEGKATFELDPEATRSLVVETSVADVVVTGTVFEVSVLPDDVRVHVTRGSVRIEPKVASLSPVNVEAGQFVMLSRGQVEQETVSGDEEIPALAQADDEAAGEDGEVAREDGSDTRRRVTRRKSARTHRDTDDEGLSLGELMRQARQCRSAGQWACAARKYKSIAKRFPNNPESLTVLVPLAEIELEKLRRPRAALRHYRRYLEHEPRGALAPEAHFGKCRAYEKLARPAEEEDCLRAFLRIFPKSIHVRRAKERLVAISGPKY